MKIFNTLTGKKEEFIPITEGKVRLYVCGPTVYNFIHIGNARPMVVFDTFRRFLESTGYEVTYVSNFTDIDDKIIKKALEQNRSAADVAKEFIKACKEDMQALNVAPATIHPLATKEIDAMHEMISILLDKDFAYVGKDHTVYFRTRKFNRYGKLSHKNLDDLQGNRDLSVSGDDFKEDSLDFVLWKPKKEGEPFWNSPWGDGRPGWHIECSAMIYKYLGTNLDIHCGGEDLIFPHHENEIAQSEACTGRPFAHYWMHNAFLNIDSKKMSKSLGNFFTVREIGEEFELNVLRFVLLSVHYRSPLNFSKELMESGKQGLNRMRTCARRLAEICGIDLDKKDREFDINDVTNTEIKAFAEDFNKEMEDDCNTANALAVIFELVKFSNKRLDMGAQPKECLEMLTVLAGLCYILGLTLNDPSPDKEMKINAEEIEKLIQKRSEAKKAKDFMTADAIRNELLKQGILLEDTPQGVKWKRK